MPGRGAMVPLTERVSRRWPLVSAATALLMAALLALVIVYREADKPFGFEIEWMGEVIEHRGQPWTAIALAFNYAGGGIVAIAVVPTIVIVILLLLRRPWGALYFAISSLACVAVVQLLKQLVGRPRPLDILVQTDPGSFPSGHSANAAVMTTVLAILFPRMWVRLAGILYTAAMMISRTYLGAHWVSDTIGGVLIGVGLAVIAWAPLAPKLETPNPAVHRQRRPAVNHSAT